MKRFKVYLHLKDGVDDAIKTYAEVFAASVYKRNVYTEEDITKTPSLSGKLGEAYFGVLKLYGELMVMISKHSEHFMPPFGVNSSIIVFFDTDKGAFNDTYDRMQKSPAFKLVYDKDTWNTWGTQIVCFQDQWGIRWILELDVRKVDNNWNPIKLVP